MACLSGCLLEESEAHTSNPHSRDQPGDRAKCCTSMPSVNETQHCLLSRQSVILDQSMHIMSFHRKPTTSKYRLRGKACVAALKRLADGYINLHETCDMKNLPRGKLIINYPQPGKQTCAKDSGTMPVETQEQVQLC